MPLRDIYHADTSEHRKWTLFTVIALVLGTAILIGAYIGYSFHEGGSGRLIALILLPVIPLSSYAVYRYVIFPYYRRLEDANLELHIKQEELLDVKDDLFIKFLGMYDVNYAANSPRLFSDRLKEVADITARVMGAGICMIYLYDRNKDELRLAAANMQRQDILGDIRIPVGEGIEGWTARRLEPVMLKDMRNDPRFREIPGLPLSDSVSIYCLPLYVYSNGALMGVIELMYQKSKSFTDEEINFFTTLAGIISTTIQNEHMQAELRKMNMELEQWVSEKTEELRASEERYRTLVENACDSIFVLAENGDIVFANEQAARLTGYAKYDLLHKNLFELFAEPIKPQGILSELVEGRQSIRHGDLRRAGGTTAPVDMSSVSLTIMGRRFIQAVLHDVSDRARLERLLQDKERELSAFRKK